MLAQNKVLKPDGYTFARARRFLGSHLRDQHDKRTQTGLRGECEPNAFPAFFCFASTVAQAATLTVLSPALRESAGFCATALRLRALCMCTRKHSQARVKQNSCAHSSLCFSLTLFRIFSARGRGFLLCYVSSNKSRGLCRPCHCPLPAAVLLAEPQRPPN